jgi:hypothetical protein
MMCVGLTTGNVEAVVEAVSEAELETAVEA